MINEIEDAIVTLLQDKLASAAGKVVVQKGADELTKPAVYISTEKGKIDSVTASTWKHSLTVYVDILFSYRGADDRQRRKGIYLILEGVLQELLGETLGLKIKALEPKGWNNTTTEEFQKQGMLVFSMEIATSYTITKLEETLADDLLRIGLNYFLTPGDDVADASDLVTLDGDTAALGDQSATY